MLFPSRRSKAQRMLEKAKRDHAAFQKKERMQNALLDEAHLAKERYKENKDVEAAIEKFEDLERRGLISSWHQLFLAELYLKAGMNDKAWGYLNSLLQKSLTGGNPPAEKIRAAQAKLLKKEERYKEAIEMYSLSQFNSPHFSLGEFLKDISTPAKKLGLTVDDKERLAKAVKQAETESKVLRGVRAILEEK